LSDNFAESIKIIIKYFICLFLIFIFNFLTIRFSFLKFSYYAKGPYWFVKVIELTYHLIQMIFLDYSSIFRTD